MRKATGLLHLATLLKYVSSLALLVIYDVTISHIMSSPQLVIYDVTISHIMSSLLKHAATGITKEDLQTSTSNPSYRFIVSPESNHVIQFKAQSHHNHHRSTGNILNVWREPHNPTFSPDKTSVQPCSSTYTADRKCSGDLQQPGECVRTNTAQVVPPRYRQFQMILLPKLNNLNTKLSTK